MNLFKTSLLLITTGVLAGCQVETVHREKPSLVVDMIQVSEPISSQFRVFNGVVEPADVTPLAFRVDGELSAVFVKEGDKVKQGQTLAAVDDNRYQQQLNNAQARFDLAQRQLDRGKDLLTRKMISDAEYDELTATFKLAQANRLTALTQLKYTRLKAPFDGVVSAVGKKNHESVALGESVLSLYRESRLQVKINVSDSVLAMMTPSARARNYHPEVAFAGSEQRYSMRYLEHTSELHPQTHSYEFWLERAQVTPTILPGTSASVFVDMAAAGMNVQQGYLVPMTAIDSGTAKSEFYVWKSVDNTAQRHRIVVDQIVGSGAIVSSGVKQGDVIINSNIRKLRPGMNLKGVQL